MEVTEIITENLPHDEIKYQEHMKRGKDLAKIELFLTARGEFEKARYYREGDPEATLKIEECTGRIRQDRKKVLIILPFLFAAIALVAIFGH
jgi:hypothetical protein